MPGTEDDSKPKRGRGAYESGKADTPQTGPDETVKPQPGNVEVSAQPTDAVILSTAKEDLGPPFGRSRPAVQQLASAIRHDAGTVWRRTTAWLLHALRYLKEQSRTLNTLRLGLRHEVLLSRLSVRPAKIRALLPVKLSFMKLFKHVRWRSWRAISTLVLLRLFWFRPGFYSWR